MKEDHHNKIEVIKSTEQGSVDAQKKLGDYYITSEKNQKEAVKWYGMAAKQGDRSSQEQLVRIFSKLPSAFYVEGEITVKQDLKKSFEWLKILSETENINSLHCLADCYFKGYGTEKSINKAIGILETMSANRDSTALYRLAGYYFENKNYGQAIKYLKEINKYDERKKGKNFEGIGTKDSWGFGFGSQFNTTPMDVDVNKNIAQCYLMGDGKLEKSFPKYLQYLEKSADKGNRESQRELIDYLLSQKTKKMDEKAISLLEGIVQPTRVYPSMHGENVSLYHPPMGKRDHLALYKFASCYFFGRGVDTNPEEAIKWLKESCTSESIGGPVQREESLQAKILLGICYINGEGIEKSIDEAITLFEYVARKNDAIGCLWLAYAYYIKYSEVQDTVTAFDKLAVISQKTASMGTLTETETREENDRYRRVSSVNSFEESMILNIKESAINFMHENTSYDDSFIVPDIVFPQNIVGFLEGNDNPSAKVILAFYYRSIKNAELFLSCLTEANSKLDIIASYTLGLHYEKEKSFDKAVEYFEKIIATDKSYTYPLETTKHVKTSAEHEIKLIEYKYRLEEKNKELNNLISMFAHNFLGTLQCIRSNAEHDNNPNIHLKTVKMMGGALTAFSIISADDDKLIEQLKQDNTGESNLFQCLANNLALAISLLLSKTNKDKIINIYLNTLQKTGQIKSETDGEKLRSDKGNRKKWQDLQHQWEDEFNALFSEQVELSELIQWINDNFFAIKIIGFDGYSINFQEYGITDSIFLVVLMETLVNALKYMDVKVNKPLTLSLCKQNNIYQLSCENPSQQESYRGTHKGMDFLQTIANKLNGEFISEPTENTFKTTLSIPAQLLD